MAARTSGMSYWLLRTTQTGSNTSIAVDIILTPFSTDISIHPAGNDPKTTHLVSHLSQSQT